MVSICGIATAEPLGEQNSSKPIGEHFDVHIYLLEKNEETIQLMDGDSQLRRVRVVHDHSVGGTHDCALAHAAGMADRYLSLPWLVENIRIAISVGFAAESESA